MKKNSLAIINFTFAALMLTGCNVGTPQLGKSLLEDVVAAMTVEEKADLLVGSLSRARTDTAVIVGIKEVIPGAAGTSNAVERLGIPNIVFADGPAGLRINPTREGDSATYHCTHFPIGTLLASTWNPELVENVGKAMGNEVLEYGADVLLAPALNIHRNPLCGRNFEYFSEDPVLSGKIAAAYVRGVQAIGVGTSVKHFAANNQETNRMSNDSHVSQRALRELYLKGFEIVVKEADPWTVMSSYNYLNGIYTSENPELLDSLLRKEWGYKGMIVSDWFAGQDAPAQMRAGNDMLQGGLDKQYKAIVAGVKEGKLKEEYLDHNVKRVLELALRTPRFKGYRFSNKPDLQAHAEVTRQSATEGMVLLKNDNGTLPMDSCIRNIALFGCTAYDFIGGGTGSGMVHSAYTVSLPDGLKNSGYTLDDNLKTVYEQHIAIEKKRISAMNREWFMPEIRPTEISLKEETIRKQAVEADIALITIGRTSGECYDRPYADFVLSKEERQLLRSVCRTFHAAGKRVVVVLNIGGVIETASWKDAPDAILCAWQPGQEGGNSVADILSGKVSPSGKLTMTFPIKYADVPSAANFPVDMTASLNVINKSAKKNNICNVDYTVYEEGIYVGYRYYDSFRKDISYPFGYGLSYTTFEYQEPVIEKTDTTYIVRIKVTNTGKIAGKEVVQLYVSAPRSVLDKPEKELKAFAKTKELLPGETATVTLKVSVSELASYSEADCAWIVDKGKYRFLIGASSRDIRATLTADVPASLRKTLDILKLPDYKNKALTPEQRAVDLIGRMTLDEKIMQLQCMWMDKRYIFTNGDFDADKARKLLKNGMGTLARLNENLHPSIAGEYHPTLHPRQAAELYNKIQKFFIEETRLGIPVISHEEGLHGQQSADATSFPVPIALACSWNEELFYDIYRCVGKEIRARGGGIVLAPVLDVARDPRWGRTEETMGEDPYLNTRLGIAQIKAYQGNGEYIDHEHVATTLKHFGVHGESEGGNNTAPSFMEERQAREVHLKPFRDCIRQAAPMNIMVTYNELWGEPAHANRRLLKDILRDEFGFKGIVVSDYSGISDLVNLHRMTPSIDEAGLLALKAGVDVEYPIAEGFKNLGKLVKEGRLSTDELDTAVTRVLVEKFRLRLFDSPYIDPQRADSLVGCEAHRRMAYRAAAESMVLLKNDNGFLPIDKDKYKTIALIGPNADRCILGGYSSLPKDTITPLRAMREKYGDKLNILYAEGTRLTDRNSPFPEKIELISLEKNKQRIVQAVEVAKQADLIILFVGQNEAMSREAYSAKAPGDLPTLELLGGQQELIQQLVALGKPTCAFVNSGTALDLSPLTESVPAVMQCWYLGQEGGYAMIDALFGDINPSGKLSISFPRSSGHVPAYYSYKPSSRRGYNLGLDVSPLYPFGYGLSYTTFRYGTLRIDKTTIQCDGSARVSVEVENTGAREGAEIVEMYIRDDYSSIIRPIKELKGFKKVFLKPGERQVVSFIIDSEALAFYDRNMNWTVEPGTFTIMVGPSSDEYQKVKLEVKS